MGQRTRVTAGQEPGRDTCQVLVVGAGPTGLTLACDLRRRGVDVRIVEARTEPATTSRAFALHPRGLEILEDVGVTGLADRARVVRHVTSHAAGSPLARAHLDRLARSGHPGIYLVSQAEIEAELRATLERLGGEVEPGTELVALEAHPADAPPGPRGVRATLRDVETGASTTIDAGWVVGCDGAHSTVRGLVHLPFEGRSLPETFLLTDVELAREPPTEGIQAHLHPDGLLGLFPLPGGRVWRLIAQLDDGAEVPDDADAVVELARDLLHHRADPDLEVARSIWSSRFRIHRRLAARYRDGPVLIAGDAAHVHSPFGGQGMNVGLGDATNLGWKLAAVVHGDAGEGLLDTYEAERRPVAEAIVARTTLATRFATTSGGAPRIVRDQVLPALARWRSARPTHVTPPRAVVEWFTQLRVGYRDGPLGLDGGPGPFGAVRRARQALRAGPLPGDRLPDGPVQRAAEHTWTHLRAVTRGEWVLVLVGGRHGPHRPAGAAHTRARRLVHDHLGEVTTVTLLPRGAAPPPTAPLTVEDLGLGRVLGTRPGAVLLVRPDGHLGWRSDRPGPPLERWLRRATGDPAKR